jgi:hypothetical protein
MQFTSDSLPYFPGEIDTAIHADVTKRHKRNDIRRADSRMRSLMAAQINEVCGQACALKCGLRNSVRLARKRQDSAMMIGIHFFAQQKDAGHCANNSDECPNRAWLSSLAEIRDAFDPSVHRY